MPSPASSQLVKEAASALSVPQALWLVMSAFCLGVQTSAQRFFPRRSAPPRSAPERTVLPPDTSDPLPPHDTPPSLENRPRTPAFITHYAATLNRVWNEHDWTDVVLLVDALRRCWRENRQVFLCGNGGSAANAIHLANDYLYGIAKADGHGLRVTALPANPAVLTCLANDIAYADIFAQQLTVFAQPGDLLIAFSGSGNSPNILRALTRARELGVTSFAVLGFTGGQARELADHPIYFPVHDMQIAEDLQMMIGHMAMQHLAQTGR